MPSELIDQKGVSVTARSRFFGEMCSVSEGTVWNPKFESEYQRKMHGLAAMPHSTLGSSLPVEKSLPITACSVSCLEVPPTNMAWEQMERQPIGSISKAPWKPLDHSFKQGSDLPKKPGSFSINGSKSLMNGMLHEVSLFSSSLSEMFNRKLRLSGNDVKSNQLPSTFVSHKEEEHFKSLKEIEAETIGNLLPEEDDLFSGVTDELRGNTHANGKYGEEFEEFDLFSSVGGMELGDDNFFVGNGNYDLVQDFSDGKWGSNWPNGSISGEHPSRTLVVRNIDNSVKDSELKALFEQYGDIQALSTACKHRGFVMITYYDLRAAQSAMRALHNKPMKHRKLDMHYAIPKDNPSEKYINQGILVIFNLDSSVSNNELHQIFRNYGDVKKICEAPHQPHNKLIEFYDVRAAVAALHALDKSEIGKKQIKLELSLPGGARWSLTQIPDLKLDEPNSCHIPAAMASNCAVSSSNQGLYSGKLFPMSILTENALSRHSSSFPNTFPYPKGVASSGEQFGFESRNSIKDIEFGKQCIPGFHPHSFPEHHDIPLNTLSALGNVTTAGLGVSIVDNRNNHRVNANRHPLELNGGVFGSPANGSCGVCEHHYVLNKTNSYQHPSSSMLWQNSPSFVNSLNSHCFPQMPGFPRGPSHVLGSASTFSHHIGAAPAVNPSPWEIRAYSGDPSEMSSSIHGSLGSVGFAGTPQLHSLDISSCNIISQVGRNCMDMTTNPMQCSSQHIGHIFPGRNEMISVPFDSLNECSRNSFPRRNEVNLNSAKQYELDIDRILHGKDSRTTLMIKNIPNKYTSKMLLVAIDERCRGTYDFLYLPIDFKNKCNVGYAFINMIDPRQIVPFYQAFNGKKWEKFNSEKVACLAYARIQGKASLITHFQNSSLMNEDKRCRPILFQTNGPNAGDPEPFPMGTNIRARQEPRMSVNEENHNQASSAETSRKEEISNRQEASVLVDQTCHLETNYFI